MGENISESLPILVGGTLGNGLEMTTVADAEETLRQSSPSKKEFLGMALTLQATLFAVAFTLLALLSLVYLGQLVLRARRASRQGGGGGPSLAYLIALTLQTAIQGTVTAMYLFTDPFNLVKTFHPAAAMVIGGVHNPALSSAFLLLYMALMRMTKMKLLYGGLLKSWLVVTIVLVNYLVMVAADTISVIYAGWMPLLYTCDVYFILWGVAYFSLFVYTYHHYHVTVVANRKLLSDIGGSVKGGGGGGSTKKTAGGDAESGTSGAGGGGGGAAEPGAAKKVPPHGPADTGMPLAMKISLLAAVLFLMYSVTATFKTLSREIVGLTSQYVWVWWALKTALLTLQLLLGATILFVAALPSIKN